MEWGNPMTGLPIAERVSRPAPRERAAVSESGADSSDRAEAPAQWYWITFRQNIDHQISDFEAWHSRSPFLNVFLVRTNNIASVRTNILLYSLLIYPLIGSSVRRTVSMDRPTRSRCQVRIDPHRPVSGASRRRNATSVQTSTRWHVPSSYPGRHLGPVQGHQTFELATIFI